MLPLAGVFARHDGPCRQALGTPNHAVWIAADRPYRISYPGGRGDDCLTLRFSNAALARAWPRAARRLRFAALSSMAGCCASSASQPSSWGNSAAFSPAGARGEAAVASPSRRKPSRTSARSSSRRYGLVSGSHGHASPGGGSPPWPLLEPLRDLIAPAPPALDFRRFPSEIEPRRRRYTATAGYAT